MYFAKKNGIAFDEEKNWYDGYSLKNIGDIYSPRSVVQVMKTGIFDDYWNQTETFVAATRVSKWDEIMRSVVKSDNLLKDVWDKNEESVAEGIENAHLETSHLQYNDDCRREGPAASQRESWLRRDAITTLSLAFYAARQYYTIVRELPTGKGFADLAFIPRKKYADKPAMLVELKWDKYADTALKQIEEKNYPEALKDYKDNLLLVGINYDKKTRKHECRIR